MPQRHPAFGRVTRRCQRFGETPRLGDIVQLHQETGQIRLVALVLHRHLQNDTLPVGDLTLTFMHTPGHTPGSQCFLVDGRLISGDTLFIGACGRTDLPGSDPKEMYYSLTQRLAALPDDTVLLPGHNYGGESSTIGREKQENRFMQFPSLRDFLAIMGGGRTRLG